MPGGKDTCKISSLTGPGLLPAIGGGLKFVYIFKLYAKEEPTEVMNLVPI